MAYWVTVSLSAYAPQCRAGRNSFVAKQAQQLSADECCDLYVIGTATERAEP